MSTWKVDDTHSSIRFGVRHAMIAMVRGRFGSWSAELTMDPNDLAGSSMAMMIDPSSVETGNAQRDASLRSPTFFAVEEFPSMTFRSRRVERLGDESYRVVGDLTLRGITKEVVFEVEHGGFATDPRGMRRAGFSVRGSVRRTDFGMVFNQTLETGGVAIGENVDIAADIEAMLVTPAA